MIVKNKVHFEKSKLFNINIISDDITKSYNPMSQPELQQLVTLLVTQVMKWTCTTR